MTSSQSLEEIKAAEEKVLIRALRDSNIPKIVDDDLEVFMGLIGDLFPGIDIPRLVDETFEATIARCARDAGLQAEDSFILKVVQLEELLVIRHSVFILGSAGTGKSQCWKTLARTYQAMGKKILMPALNPKAVTTKELYGFIHPQTREWKDGLYSIIMRDLANIPNTEPKWIVLDGDIDPCVARGELVADLHGVGRAVEGLRAGERVLSTCLQHDADAPDPRAIPDDPARVAGRAAAAAPVLAAQQTSPRRAVFRVATESGRALRVTDNHKFLIRRNGALAWARTDELCVASDELACGPLVGPLFGSWGAHADALPAPGATSGLAAVLAPLVAFPAPRRRAAALALVRVLGCALHRAEVAAHADALTFTLEEEYDAAALESDLRTLDAYPGVTFRTARRGAAHTVEAHGLVRAFREAGAVTPGGALAPPVWLCEPGTPAIVVREFTAAFLAASSFDVAVSKIGAAYAVTLEPAALRDAEARTVPALLARLGVRFTASGGAVSVHDTDENVAHIADAVGLRFSARKLAALNQGAVLCRTRQLFCALAGPVARALKRGADLGGENSAARHRIAAEAARTREEFAGDRAAAARLLARWLLPGVLDALAQGDGADARAAFAHVAAGLPVTPSDDRPRDGSVVAFSRLLAVTADGHAPVYDATVPGHHFIAGGLVTHNCWIESLNTCMDDNKVLTLASNERIPLHDHMRLLFEIGNLQFATPATVSRAGIIYINESDVGFGPFFQSWVEKRESSAERSQLTILFEKYVPTCLDHCPKHFKSVCPLSPISAVETLTRILDSLLTSKNIRASSPKDIIEWFFVFALVWAVGGPLYKDQLVDHRHQFSQWWRAEWKTIAFPLQGSVFDYLIEVNEEGTPRWVTWEERVPPYKHDPDLELSQTLVKTTQVTQLHYMLDLMLPACAPVLFAGFAGSGKSILMKQKLQALPDQYMNQTINLNYYTTTAQLQLIMEQNLEKKAGRTFGPPGQRRLVYMIDDLNMAQVDEYGTQAPITLLRQHRDYSAWYDREKMTIKDIQNVQFVACLNPSAGSFEINPRYQRHFSLFAVDYPTGETLKAIYGAILQGHFSKDFSSAVQQIIPNIVTALLSLHEKVQSVFLPTAIKFHYQFNLRDLTNTVGGLLRAVPANFRHPLQLARLFAHEVSRVYHDRFICADDMSTFNKLLEDNLKTNLDIKNVETDALLAQPYIFNNFAKGLGEGTYAEVDGFGRLNPLLEEALEGHNEEHATMDLVLFEDAMDHVSRISRIIAHGDALLVGVGGSGKQSLARLASFIAGYDVFQITISSGYSVADFKLDLQQLYLSTGLKGNQIVFLFTDSQIVDEEFLVYINDLLSSGHIAGLFEPDEEENIIGQIRNEVKQAGLIDTKENCWDYFISKVKTNLHVVLGFSPVGDFLRVRARKFPALVNCTTIDWFHPWPHEALYSVAQRFLSRLSIGSEDITLAVARFMADITGSVDQASVEYAQLERRHNYTTPKSFLELISLYTKLLTEGSARITAQIERLEAGNVKLEKTESDVTQLKQELSKQQVLVEERKKAADDLLVQVAHDQAIVEDKVRDAAVEQEACAKIKADVEEQQAVCELELAKAEPAVEAAVRALNTLNKNNLVELKSFGKPPEEIIMVMEAVMWLVAPPGVAPRDLSWNAAKKVMGNVQQFLRRLVDYDKDNIHPVNLKGAKEITTRPNFTGEYIVRKSEAAAGICDWARNIIIYFEIYQDVLPKRQRLEEANQALEAAQKKLQAVEDQVAKLERRLNQLKKKFEDATNEKNRVIEQAERTQSRLNLANRLVNGLASEKVRWLESVKELEKDRETLVGDMLLTAAFISYIGPFSRTFREKLIEQWTKRIGELGIPLCDNSDPMTMLTDDATVAQWNNDDLPTDRISLENASILTSCERWPLIIDPQLQGVTWLKKREENAGRPLKVIRLNQAKWVDAIEHAVSNGDPVLIENLGETIDAVLNPIIGRNIMKRGHSLLVKLGDKEIEYDKNFKLYLQTKMANPHYSPEIQAQTTLINFTVTEDGLEDQLLALVVNEERPDLEKQKSDLMRQRNEFMIRLKDLEASLLQRLSAATGDILADTALIENLETTKKTSLEIKEKVEEARVTEQNINKAREMYRPVAARASMLYFLLNSLHIIDSFYQFSLKAFTTVFFKAIRRSEKSDDVEERVNIIINHLTYSVYAYASRGLFERHKLIFVSQLTFKILQKKGELPAEEFDFLLRGPQTPGRPNPLREWLLDSAWQSIVALSQLEEFVQLPDDIEGSAKRWREWIEQEQPEFVKLPQDWKNKTPLQRLCILRALRPDRLQNAMTIFVAETLGQKYIDSVPYDLLGTFNDSLCFEPIFFILSPGVDPLKDVEAMGHQLGFTSEAGRFRNVSLGQGQEIVAERAVEEMATRGGWVMLQNLHLMKVWLPRLEKMMEQYCVEGGSHDEFRLFLTAEPASNPQEQAVTPGILQVSIKVTNEPPRGIKANMLRALSLFSQDTLDMCSKPNEFRSILFALVFFHATILERRKFGPIGWNIPYPFNTGDLTISKDVLYNYLETNTTVPWDDLKYMFCDILYGGHITDDWDRRLCRTFLDTLMSEELFEDKLLAPEFPAPPPSSLDEYRQYVHEVLPPENPKLFGLHPNAEIGFLTDQSNLLFKTIFELQPRDTVSASGVSREDRVRETLDDIFDTLPDNFDMVEIMERIETRTPYVSVCLQECTRMNTLLTTIRLSLKELDLGLKGELTISEAMENLMDSLFKAEIPARWNKVAYPSLKPLGMWVTDLQQRVKQLQDWQADLNLPTTVWLSGLFNPQSFLRGVLQATARANKWPLDKMFLNAEVSKKNIEDITIPPREGAYIYGLFMEGARWDKKGGCIRDSFMKELFAPVPPIFLRAVPSDRAETRDTYECPVYITRMRGPTYVWAFNLKTREPPSKWILAGVAVLLSSD